MTNHSIRRLRIANPAPTTHIENDALLARILALPGDSRATAQPQRRTNTRFIRTQRTMRRRPLLALLAAGFLLLGTVGVGIAASRLFKSPAQEEQGLPGGSAMFIGTHPTCTPVSDQQFRCVLQFAPTVEFIVGSYFGAKMQSVDTSNHVDGGCIATSDNGLAWDCYLGRAAVTHGILDQSLLGQYQPQPSHG